MSHACMFDETQKKITPLYIYFGRISIEIWVKSFSHTQIQYTAFPCPNLPVLPMYTSGKPMAQGILSAVRLEKIRLSRLGCETCAHLGARAYQHFRDRDASRPGGLVKRCQSVSRREIILSTEF